MAARRMFSLNIINSARFLKMPIDSQVLYFHLGLRADDDGIVEVYPIMKMLGNTEDNLKVLVAKEFVKVLNEDLVSFITDWREHNQIRADRKINSIYKKLLLQIIPNMKLVEPKKRADTGVKPRQPINWTSSGRPSIGKESIGKDIKDKSPTPFNFKEKFPYLTNSDFLSIWNAWLEVRKKIKAPSTEQALRLSLIKLSKHPLEMAIKMLEQSVERGYRSVFLIKEDYNGRGKRDNGKPSKFAGYEQEV